MQVLPYAKFLESVGQDHASIVSSASRYPDFTGLVLFRNHQMGSSAFWARSVALVGPSNTFTSIEACEGLWLNDMPSRRRYAEAYVRRQDIRGSVAWCDCVNRPWGSEITNCDQRPCSDFRPGKAPQICGVCGHEAYCHQSLQGAMELFPMVVIGFPRRR